MMKKFLVLFLSLLLLAGAAGCGGCGAVLEEIEMPELATPALTSASTPTVQTTESPEPTPEPTPFSSVTWEVNPKTRTLTISGEGPMPDYDVFGDDEPPWGDQAIDTFTGEGVYNRVIIEEGVTRIGSGAFTWNALESISLPDSLLSIGEGAFVNASAKRLTIPKNVEIIETAALRGAFREFRVASQNQHFCVKDGVLFSKDMTRLVAYPLSKNVFRYKVPSSVTHIGDNAFGLSLDYYSSRLEAIILPEGLVSIGEQAFAFCQYLTEFKLPSSVRHIGELAFSCARVFELELPEGMTEIGPGAFWGSMLRLVIIPASMKKIGAQAFWDSSLGEAYFVGLPPKLEESEWGGLPFDRIRGELTIYYPRVLASAWAPNGETTWNGYNIKPYDTLPEITGNWDEPGILRWGDEW